MVLRVLVARAELLQTRAVTRWEDGEEDGRPGRRSSTLNSHLVGSNGGTDYAETDHARRALRIVSTGGRLMDVPAPTAAIAATSGRLPLAPSGLHPMRVTWWHTRIPAGQDRQSPRFNF